MTSLRLMAILLLSFVVGALAAAPASATTIQVLSPQDVAAYQSAFNAAEHGDFDAADLALQQVRDPCLLGEVRMLRLMHPTAYTAPYSELAAWLRQFYDRPSAERVYALALRRRLSGDPPQRPMLMVNETGSIDVLSRTQPTSRGRAAREAYYNGDVTRALTLAVNSGEYWIAGLAAWRLGQFSQAADSFATVARNPAEDTWLRAAAGFWAARSAEAAGAPDRAAVYLQIAANYPTTFYGLLAGRRLEMSDDPLGHVVQAAVALSSNRNSPAITGFDPAVMIRNDPRARRAVALMQVGRTQDAALELRAGLALAGSEADRAHWTALALTLNPVALSAHPIAEISFADYQAPDLTPRGGFILDRALVYALVRQESRFNAGAVSRAGAVGLMQVMPATAAITLSDGSTPGRRALMDPATNLQIGQTYLAQLLQRDTGFDILQALAAYNGGPLTVTRTLQRLGDASDPLIVMESLPFQETRNYVERVMANYWIYRQQFGQPTRTLDALVSGARTVDIRLDGLLGQNMQVETRPAPAPAPAQRPVEAFAAFDTLSDAPASGGLVQRPLYQQGLTTAAPTHGGLQPALNRD